MARTSATRRKSLAIALAVLGVAGLSLASAAQLNLTGTASVQSGVLAVNADCQPSTKVIAVTFDAPTLVAGSYASANVKLAGIDAACSGKKYKLSLLDSGNALIGAEQAATLPTVVAPATNTLTLAIPSGTDNTIKTVALTIYS